MNKNYIDSIRGIAILMVILVHTSQVIKHLGSFELIISRYGQMGVQLFFVASAYTLCLSSSKRGVETNGFKKYAVRRYFRIAPAYYIGILSYFLLSLVENWLKSGQAQGSPQYSFVNILSNLFFIHGFYPPANNSIVPGGWSIGTEMAFYVIFPFLYSLSRKSELSSPKNSLRWIFSALLISQLLLFVIYTFSNYTLENNSGFLYFNLVNQFPVFIIGIAYYYLEGSDALKTSWQSDVFIFLFLTAISLTLYELKITHLLSIIPFVSGVSFVFLIKLFKEVDVLNQPFLMKIGKVSYSMYLVHFIFAYKLSDILIYKFNFLLNERYALVILYAISVMGSLSVALLSEKYIEKPFVKLGQCNISETRIGNAFDATVRFIKAKIMVSSRKYLSDF